MVPDSVHREITKSLRTVGKPPIQIEFFIPNNQIFCDNSSFCLTSGRPSFFCLTCLNSLESAKPKHLTAEIYRWNASVVMKLGRPEVRQNVLHSSPPELQGTVMTPSVVPPPQLH